MSDETHASSNSNKKKRKWSTAEAMFALAKEAAKKELERMNEEAKAYVEETMPAILKDIQREAEMGNTKYTLYTHEGNAKFARFLCAELRSDEHKFRAVVDNTHEGCYPKLDVEWNESSIVDRLRAPPSSE